MQPADRRLSSHLGTGGEARMVDVSGKAATERTAIAEGRVVMQTETLDIVLNGNAKKGDVLGAARIAGIMAAKRTHRTHPALPSAADHQGRRSTSSRTTSCPASCVQATVKVTGQTGVEMEALTAVSVACLTIYDMVKAVERGMRIEGIRLLEKQRRQVRQLSRRRSVRGAGMSMALLSVADALARVLDGVEPLPREDVPLVEADGRVLAADVAALRTQPPADLSAMDGYAVRAADVATVPATLKVVGEVAAGRPFAGEVVPAKPRASSPAAWCRPAPTPS